ncbi:MAG: carbohydrate-binding protein [Vibrio sp.]
MKRILLTYLLLFSPLSYAYDEWNKNTIYKAGDIVVKDNILYVSTHWNKTNPPQNNENNWDGWVKFPNNAPNWDSSTPYQGGDVVTYQDKFYLAKYWNNGATPATSEAWLVLIGAGPISTTTKEEPLDPESKEAILGIDSNNNGLDDEYETKIEQTYQNEADKELAKAIGIQWRSMMEYYFIDSDIDETLARNTLYQSSFLYICSAKKSRSDPNYISPHEIYFTTIERSYAYRMAEIKLYKAANYPDQTTIDDKLCNSYQ